MSEQDLSVRNLREWINDFGAAWKLLNSVGMSKRDPQGTTRLVHRVNILTGEVEMGDWKHPGKEIIVRASKVSPTSSEQG